jgi:phospholipid-binding lipoprotein MlaA
MNTALKIQASHVLPLIVAVLLCGCASTSDPDAPYDPLEGFNRSMYTFNDNLDRAVLKPVAQAYNKVLPPPVNRGVSNFFNNLKDVVVIANDLFQVKPAQAASDFARVVFNTSFGIGGLFDVATYMGHPRHNEDFGQTLGTWGVNTGAYIVLPLLGPTTVRDGIGGAIDTAAFDPFYEVFEQVPTRNSLIALRVVDTRAGLLSASRILETAALDPYSFTRNAYLQRRQSLVYDGNPPRPSYEDFDDADDYQDDAGE